MNRLRTATLFVGAALVANIVTRTHAASAETWFKMSPTSCQIVDGSVFYMGTGAFSGPGTLLCPVTDQYPAALAQNYTNLWVDVWLPWTPYTGGHSSIGTSTCSNSYSGYSYACGPSVVAYGIGYNALTPDRSVWTTHSLDYKYLLVSVGEAGMYFNGWRAPSP